jgi:hypothetical protein
MIASAVLLVLGIGGVVVLMSDERGSSNRVWSAEHGHWHDASGRELGAGSSVPAAPTGPAPAGKVWSAEHGHWHDAP